MHGCSWNNWLLSLVPIRSWSKQKIERFNSSWSQHHAKLDNASRLVNILRDIVVNTYTKLRRIRPNVVNVANLSINKRSDVQNNTTGKNKADLAYKGRPDTYCSKYVEFIVWLGKNVTAFWCYAKRTADDGIKCLRVRFKSEGKVSYIHTSWHLSSSYNRIGDFG